MLLRLRYFLLQYLFREVWRLQNRDSVLSGTLVCDVFKVFDAYRQWCDDLSLFDDARCV